MESISNKEIPIVSVNKITCRLFVKNKIEWFTVRCIYGSVHLIGQLTVPHIDEHP